MVVEIGIVKTLEVKDPFNLETRRIREVKNRGEKISHDTMILTCHRYGQRQIKKCLIG